MSIYQKKMITSGCRLWPSTCVSNYRYHTRVPARLIPQQWCWKTPNSVFQICLGCHRTAPGEKIRVCQIWLLVWLLIWLLIWSFIWLLIWILLSPCIWVLQTQGLTFPLNYGHLTAAPNTVHGEVNRYMAVPPENRTMTYFFTRWFIGLSEPCSTGPASSHFGETPTRPFTFGSWMKCFPIFDAVEPIVRTAIVHVNSTSTICRHCKTGVGSCAMGWVTTHPSLPNSTTALQKRLGHHPQKPPKYAPSPHRLMQPPHPQHAKPTPLSRVGSVAPLFPSPF